MIPTVEQLMDDTAFHLGDTQKRRFKDAELGKAVQMAWEEMFSQFVLHGVKAAENIVTYTLPAGINLLAPLTAGIASFGELVRLEEKANGAAPTDYTKVTLADPLPDEAVGGGALTYYRWANEQFHFTPVPGARDLRITYLASGALATSGSVGVDDCGNVVSRLAAAILGPTKGLEKTGARLRDEVYRMPNHMATLIRSMQKIQQHEHRQAPAYSAARNAGFGRYPIVIG